MRENEKGKNRVIDDKKCVVLKKHLGVRVFMNISLQIFDERDFL